MTQEQQRRQVGPVPVLEHEEKRMASAHAGKEIGNRRVEAVALRIGVGRNG